MSAIAIVGGGTAGAASALFLARAGHRVSLYERVPEPSAVGAGILLQPIGMRVLEALELLDEILAHGARITKLHGTTRGRTVLDVRYADFSATAFGLGLHRGALFSVLWRAVKQADINVQTGIDVSDVRQDARSAKLFRGDTLLGEFDCVIVADGTRSHLRERLALTSQVRHYPWGALWAVVPDDGLTSGVLRQWFHHADQMLGIMPTGFAYGQLQQPVLSLFWSLHETELAAWQDAGLAVWKERVRALAPIDAILAHIKSPDQLTYARYADVRMPLWHTGRVVCIGDCAHATSPQLGQGANLALVDAMVLAECLARDAPVAPALAAYSKKRKAHLRYYQSASRWLTPLFQSHSRIGSSVRDLALGAICRAPYTRTQMARTLSGTKSGWLFGSLKD